MRVKRGDTPGRHNLGSVSETQEIVTTADDRVTLGFPDDALDLLLALSAQILAKAPPMKDRDPPQRWHFNQFSAGCTFRRHITHASIAEPPFPGPLAEGQGHVSYLLFHPHHFFGRNRLTQQSVVAHDPDPPDA